ncbi:MAG: molybdopterin-dependent oxidoreductase [Anaerolineae bacterium]
MRRVTRREMLRLTVLGVAGSVAAACGTGDQDLATRPAVRGGSVPATTPTTSLGIAAPTDTVEPASKMPPFITPNEAFYVQTFGNNKLGPDVTDRAFKFRIGGLVDNPVALSLDEIKARETVNEMRTMACISNPVGGDLIGNATWTGIRLKPLLEYAGLQAGAQEIVMRAADNYWTSVPVEDLMRDDVLLVYEMNGQQLPRAHGYPLRILIPGRYGQKQPKWITQLEVIDGQEKGYWEKQGWSNEAFIKVNSRIDVPKDGQRIADAAFTVGGVAFAGRSGVDQVQVSTDDGTTWHEAALQRGSSDFAWVHWRYDWDVPAINGKTTIWARATDGEGVTQERPSFRILGGTFPEGTSQMHTVVAQIQVIGDQ